MAGPLMNYTVQEVDPSPSRPHFVEGRVVSTEGVSGSGSLVGGGVGLRTVLGREWFPGSPTSSLRTLRLGAGGSTVPRLRPESGSWWVRSCVGEGVSADTSFSPPSCVGTPDVQTTPVIDGTPGTRLPPPLFFTE